jgi:DNA-directed RNA polymerase subunit alpha
MINFEKYSINLDTKSVNDQYSKITISRLEKGMGVTIGNAMRRTLMLATPGCAMFAIKISGVSHEFQAIDGIYEDVTQIILNLKNLVISIDKNVYSDENLKGLKIEN